MFNSTGPWLFSPLITAPRLSMGLSATSFQSATRGDTFKMQIQASPLPVISLQAVPLCINISVVWILSKLMLCQLSYVFCYALRLLVPPLLCLIPLLAALRLLIRAALSCYLFFPLLWPYSEPHYLISLLLLISVCNFFFFLLSITSLGFHCLTLFWLRGENLGHRLCCFLSFFTRWIMAE